MVAVMIDVWLRAYTSFAFTLAELLDIYLINGKNIKKQIILYQYNKWDQYRKWHWSHSTICINAYQQNDGLQFLLTWVIQNGSNIFVKQIHYQRYIYFFESTDAFM